MRAGLSGSLLGQQIHPVVPVGRRMRFYPSEVCWGKPRSQVQQAFTFEHRVGSNVRVGEGEDSCLAVAADDQCWGPFDRALLSEAVVLFQGQLDGFDLCQEDSEAVADVNLALRH